MRIALGLEYDGSPFFGWQHQIGKPTLQEAVEKAIGLVADSKQRIPVFCAGRTDTGVHATHQIIHFETEIKRNILAWQLGVNRYLPRHIRVLWSKEASPSFHARFSAIKRSYAYLIYNHAVPSALFATRSYCVRHPLDVEKMNEAAEHWVGEYDFSSFRAAGCQATSANRTVYAFHIHRQNNWIWMEVTANAFLYHMVRNMVGSLIQVGRSEKPPLWAKALLVAKDRKQAAFTSPSQGLYFLGAEYPAHFEIPIRKSSPLPLAGGLEPALSAAKG